LILICGLGNKGAEYAFTRHNMGYLVIDQFSKRYKVAVNRRSSGCRVGEQQDFLLVKPDTYMNLSGAPVSSLMKKRRVSAEGLLLVHDDLDMEFGKIRIKWGGRDGGHKGVRSVADALGSGLFYRLKIGIGRDPSMEPEDYVLSTFDEGEKGRLREVLDVAAEAVHSFIFQGKEKAMSIYNRSMEL
jgi:PTH1 family peptidyl-tRNA hydrolase